MTKYGHVGAPQNSNTRFFLIIRPFLAIFMLFLNSGTGSFPVSAARPAKIDIINFVFLLILLKIFFVWLALYTAVIKNN